MNIQQIAILALVVVLVGVGAWSLLSGESPSDEPVATKEVATEAGLRAEDRDPTKWRLGTLPKVEPVRAFTTESGVRVLVLEEGRGEAAQIGHSMSLRYTGYLLDKTVFEDGVLAQVILGDRQRWIEGLQDGIQDMRPFERRRILVPNELAYGGRASDRVPAFADVVFDLRWIKLEITDLKDGTGTIATPGKTITVRYRGELEDGTVFEETEPGESVKLLLAKGSLIDGWVYGLTGMRVGGERRLWVPSHMAYGGGRGRGNKLPPWADLVFIVELLDIE